jgi:hypothetical protein
MPRSVDNYLSDSKVVNHQLAEGAQLGRKVDPGFC